MRNRQLGKANIEIAPIVFGGNVFGWTIDEKTSFELLDAFISEGYNCIDTADVYSNWLPSNTGGESETIIGKWLHARGHRSRLVLATKVGMEMSPGQKGLKKSHIMQSVEGSLKRLQTDYIDLYQAHKDDPETPLEETLEAFDALIKQGKVRAIGASNYGADRLQKALEVSKEKSLHRYESLQPLYNLYDRDGFERELEKVCLEHKVGVISYFSLASGFLSGKYRSEADIQKSPRGQGIKGQYMNTRGAEIIAALDEVAQELNSNPAQVSLAWLLHRPSVTAPIVSATNLEQLRDLIQAPHLDLSPEQVRKLTDASNMISE